jgi:pimeloyl-[acyl-carrier protein] methyl ester esterase
MTGGSAATVVLIHGWGFSPAIWQPVREALGHRRVVSPALPGHGGRADGQRLADPEMAAQAVAEQLPADLVEPVWVGWSLGGLVALALAARWRGPQRLVLVCATPRFTTGPGWQAALDPAALASFGAELARDRVALERRFAALCADGSEAPARLRRQLLTGMSENPAALSGLGGGLMALAGGDLRPVWARLEAPVSAWIGESDRLIPAAAAEALAALRPDVQLRRVPGGHASWLENPEGLADFIREVKA